MTRKINLIFLALSLPLVGFGCSEDTNNDTSGNVETDADTDSDADSDADSDTDADADFQSTLRIVSPVGQTGSCFVDNDDATDCTFTVTETGFYDVGFKLDHHLIPDTKVQVTDDDNGKDIEVKFSSWCSAPEGEYVDDEYGITYTVQTWLEDDMCVMDNMCSGTNAIFEGNTFFVDRGGGSTCEGVINEDASTVSILVTRTNGETMDLVLQRQ